MSLEKEKNPERSGQGKAAMALRSGSFVCFRDDCCFVGQTGGKVSFSCDETGNRVSGGMENAIPIRREQTKGNLWGAYFTGDMGASILSQSGAPPVVFGSDETFAEES